MGDVNPLAKLRGHYAQRLGVLLTWPEVKAVQEEITRLRGEARSSAARAARARIGMIARSPCRHAQGSFPDEGDPLRCPALFGATSRDRWCEACLAREVSS